MFCSKCGRLLDDGVKFCPGCGKQIKTAAVEKETRSVETGVFEENAEMTEDETAAAGELGIAFPEGINNGNENFGEMNGADSQNYYNNGQSYNAYTYNGEENFKVKGKRSAAATVICTIFSIVMTVIASTIMMSIVLSTSITSCMPENLFEEAFGDMKCSEIQIGYLLDKSEGYDKDTTLAEYVYDKMDDEQKGRMDEKDVADIIDDTTIGKYILKTADKYVEVVCGERDEVSIKKEDIVELIEENEDLVEEISGRKLTKTEYDKIEKLIDDSGVEKISLSKEDIYGGGADTVRFAKLLTGGTITMIVNIVLGFAALFFIFVIFLLNTHKPRLVCLYSGVAVFFAGINGLLFGAGTKFLINYFDGEYGVYSLYNVLRVYAQSLMNRFFLVGEITLAVSVVLFIIFAVLKHRAKKLQPNSWERGMGNV